MDREGCSVILNGWKEIAAHLGRGVRTVQRWESLGLPVRRPKRRDRSAVVAFTEEVDQWLKSAETREQLARDQSLSKDSTSGRFSARILVVDDDEALLVTTAAILLREGYEVRTARDGFEALAVLRGGIPDVMVSDLAMPNMSGFELLAIVRKRIPGMAVIALSGEFAPVTAPLVIADRFLQKGKDSPTVLKETIREVIAASPIRVQPAKCPAPAWVPRSTNGYVVMVCAECLRPFSVPIGDVVLDQPATEACVHCGQDFHYFVHSKVAPTDVLPPTVVQESLRRVQSAKATLEEVKSKPNSKPVSEVDHPRRRARGTGTALPRSTA